MLEGDTVFHSLVIITIQFLSYPLTASWLWFSTDTQGVLGPPPRASSAKAGLNQIIQSSNPLLWQGSWPVPVAGCVTLLSSPCLKVSPRTSRRDEDFSALDTLHEQFWEMFGQLRCGCTEQTSGRRTADKWRSGWLWKGDFASASDPLTSISHLISPMLLGRSDAHKHGGSWW